MRRLSFDIPLSLLAVGCAVAMGWNWFGASWCLWECPAPDPDGQEVWTYRATLLAAAVLVIAAFVVASLRSAAWAWLLHFLGLAVVGAAALAFAVPAIDWDSPSQWGPDVPADVPPVAPPCYSGSGDCVGG